MTIKETIEEAKKVGVKDMSWKAWFMIITIISAATVASYYGVNVTMNLDLANRVGSLEGMLSHTVNSTFYALQKQVSYIISTVTSGGTTYYCMQNGTTGKLDFWSTNASAVLANTFGNMTTGAVFLRNGIYNVSTLGSYFNVAGKDITLIGESWDDTVLLDSRTGSTYTFNTVASSSPTANFTVRNIMFDRRVPSDATAKGCIGGSFYKIDVEHCQFLGNTALTDGSSHYLTTAVCGDWASDYFVNCYFKNNRVVDLQYGITSPHSKYVDVSGNYFENCHTQTVGIQLPIENGNYIVQGNYLNNCAEFDEGIAIDSTNPAAAVNVNCLISNNIIFSDATHDPVKSICVITTSGVKISNNKILTLSTTDGDWWGQIGVEGRDYSELTNITIENNDIWTMQRVGIEARGVSSGSIKNNVVTMAYAGQEYGIRLRYTKAITYAGTFLAVTGNTVRASSGASNRLAISVESSAGTGAIAIVIDNNILEGYTGISTDCTSLVTPKIGKNNIFTVTSKVVNSGASLALYYQNKDSANNVTATTFSFLHYLVTTPTSVWASFNDIDVYGYTWTANATAINITIGGTAANFPATITAYWLAEP